MGHNYAEIDENTDTLEELEGVLYRALSKADSDDTRYQIRKALQKVQVLREARDREHIKH